MAEYNATWTEYQDAIERVFRYQTTHNNTLPAYVTVKGVNYTKKDYLDAVKRVQAYITKNKKNPPRVWLRNQNTPTKSAIRRSLEDAIGTYNTFTEFYNKLKGRGYSYYYNDIYNQSQAIQRLKNKSGLNCSDICQLAYAAAKDLGYSVRYVHIICRSGTGHIQLDVKGKEFGSSWRRVDPAAALQSSYSLGSLWCSDGRVIGYDPGWLLSDDGVT